ncbi:dTDP-4-dehydrorhamnose reductase [Thalassolituus oleivorans]|uniref:dTDP-4-dehydrorhamnose reductase n=1 Tax=Thalassolituus oleivorans TaxID=187493 RepID=UPI0003454A60|nr:dTDP-4-dehydrorhamnose reductase [Thalassolituus oleivorans]
MRYLITGADGQLGRCLQAHLTALNADFIALNSTDLDITRPAMVNSVLTQHAPNVVINAAAYNAVDAAESDRTHAYAVNADGPGYIAAWCEANDAWLVQVSSDYVFGSEFGDRAESYAEGELPAPLSVYGRSKLAGELAAASCSRHIIVRTSWLFSEYGNNFVKTMLRLASQSLPVRVVNDQVGCPTYAGDLAAALVTLAVLAQTGDAEVGVYHFAGDHAVTWFEFAQVVFAQAVELGVLEQAPALKAISTAEYPTTVKRPAFSALDCSKINALGVASSDWQLGIRLSLLAMFP